jgi:hypothetical protein
MMVDLFDLYDEDEYEPSAISPSNINCGLWFSDTRKEKQKGVPQWDAETFSFSGKGLGSNIIPLPGDDNRYTYILPHPNRRDSPRPPVF